MSIVPKDAGLLLSRGTRVRLVLAVVGLVMVAGLDMLGVLAMVPLMGIFTGMDRDTGILKFVVDAIGGSPNDMKLTMVVAGVAVLAFTLKGVITIVFRWWQTGFLARQQAETSVKLLKGYLRSPYSMHLTRNKSELMRNMTTSVSETYVSAINGTLALLAELITILAVFSVLMVLQPLLTLACILYLGGAAGIMQFFVRRRAGLLGERLMVFGEASLRHVMHALGAVKEVKLRNNPDPFVRDYRAARVGETFTRREYSFLTELPKYLLEIAFILGVAILGAALFSTMPPEEALPLLALFGAAGVRLLPSLVRTIASAATVRFGRSGAYKLIAELRLLREFRVLEDPSADQNIEPLPVGDLRVENVSFAYLEGKQVLNGVDLDVPYGSSVALVGSSGAGKSTLVDLILGLQPPASGRITFGGRDIQSSLPAWQARVGIVPQEVFLMDASLRRNIAFDVADEDIDEPRLLAAVAKAQLQDLVESSAGGLDVFVGDRGVRLSGGQRQRIGIARALYRKPDVLILDEATSSLDNDTERKITATVESLRGQMTIIVVAHRLSTVRRCDQFVMMGGGTVEAAGTFREVIESSSEFAHMVTLASLDLHDELLAD